jgi:biotin operon repressor
VWHVLWLEADKPEAAAEVWFEGSSWEELIAAFRHGVARMMGNGFTPIIEGMLDDRKASEGSLVSMLQCYGELYADEVLFQALREWRRTKATAEKRSAYLIATNRILWMISAFVPQTPEELMQIPGWGAAKHKAYAEEVLAITGVSSRSTQFPLHWVERQLDSAAYTQWLFRQKELKYKTVMDRYTVKKHILSALQQGCTLAQLETELDLPRRELLNRIEQLDEEGYDMDSLVGRELAEVPEAEQKLVWDALSLVGDKYLKPVLQQVYGGAEAGGTGQPSVDHLYERLRLIRLQYRRSKASRAG